jgi:hypothetical protein
MKSYPTKILISTGAVGLIIIHLLWSQIAVDAITLGLLIVAALPWFSSILDSIEFPGGWKVQFKELASQQEQQQAEIDTLKFLVSHFVTDAEFQHLVCLNRPGPFSYKVDETTHFFEQELRRLRSLGLIAGQEGRGVRSLKNQGQGDVKDHFQITEPGKKYLKLRAETEDHDND